MSGSSRSTATADFAMAVEREEPLIVKRSQIAACLWLGVRVLGHREKWSGNTSQISIVDIYWYGLYSSYGLYSCGLHSYGMT